MLFLANSHNNNNLFLKDKLVNYAFFISWTEEFSTNIIILYDVNSLQESLQSGLLFGDIQNLEVFYYATFLLHKILNW